MIDRQNQTKEVSLTKDQGQGNWLQEHRFMEFKI